MSEMTHEDALAHFGVKGMKWGKRKAPQAPLTSRQKTERAFRVGANVVRAAPLAIVGAVAITHALQSLANSAVAGKLASDGARATKRLFSDTHGIANHKLIDLGWDAVTGSWM